MTDDELLTPTPGPVPDVDAIVRRTGPVLRRRLWLRRGRTAAGVAAVFAGGVGTGWLTMPDPVTELQYVRVPVPVPVPESGVLAKQPADAGRSPAELELAAEATDDRTESARLFREAGDKFLTDANDIASATRCYVNHLSEAGDAKVSAADSWLLMRLKLSRTQED
jgi:hypothetical protein